MLQTLVKNIRKKRTFKQMGQRLKLFCCFEARNNPILKKKTHKHHQMACEEHFEQSRTENLPTHAHKHVHTQGVFSKQIKIN